MIPLFNFDRDCAFGDEFGDAYGKGLTLRWGWLVITFNVYRRM